MYISKLESLQRREFLRRTAALGLAGSAGPLALTLAGIGEAAAQSTSTDEYKALVCVFLYGGNDHDNTFVPYDDLSHGVYKTLRDVGDTASNIYVPQNKLTPLVPINNLASGRQYAVQEAMGDLATLFNDDKKMGVLLNVGPLVKLTNKTSYTNAKTGDLPPKLFSHNDQFSLWQSGLLEGAEGATQGWGGRLGDLFLSSDTKSSHFTCINAAGNAVFMSGKNVLPYQVTSKGAVSISSLNTNAGVYSIPACKTALGTLLNTSPSHWMEQEWARMMKSSIDNQKTVTNSLLTDPSFTTAFENDSLSAQLQIVARLIQARIS